MTKRANDGKGVLFLALSTDGGKVPEWVQIIPFGEHNTDKGLVILDNAGAAEVLENYKAMVNDLVIDYEHQTLTGKEAPAAGWIGQLENRGKDGIWANVAWCKRAAAMLESREYRYLSPVMLLDKKRRVRSLHSAALTNTPAIDGMEPVVAKQDVNGGDAAIHKEDSIKMDKILNALGLAATATEEEVIAAVNALKAAAGAIPVACKGVITALGLKDGANESEVVGTIVAMKSGSDKVTELSAKVTELTGQLTAITAEELVQVALKAGKITAGQLDWARDYAKRDAEGFKVFSAKAPAAVPIGEDHKQPADKKEAAELSVPELAVCKQLGVSAEAFKKHNAKA
jgi:phage I-like protein